MPYPVSTSMRRASITNRTDQQETNAPSPVRTVATSSTKPTASTESESPMQMLAVMVQDVVRALYWWWLVLLLVLVASRTWVWWRERRALHRIRRLGDS